MFKLSENSLASKIDNICIILSEFPMLLKVRLNTLNINKPYILYRVESIFFFQQFF